MREVGVHSLVFVPDLSKKNIEIAFRTAADIGFDLIEICILDAANINPDSITEQVKKTNVKAMAGMALSPETDISSKDGEISKNGERMIEDCISVARDIGSPILGGVTFSALKRYMSMPDNDVFKRITEAYLRLVQKAQKAGIRLGIEAVNRYESNVINTLDQAAEIVRQVNSASLFVQMDTYHMNLEESSICGAIENAKDFLGYAHVSESNRNRIGWGLFDFKTFFSTLRRINYKGDFTWESFSSRIIGEETASLLAIWRNPWTDNREAAKNALGFLKSHIETFWSDDPE